MRPAEKPVHRGSVWQTARVPHSTTTSNPSRDPAWQSALRFDRGQLPSWAKDWLLHEGSLTQRLVQASGGHFRVQRLSQRWRQPLLSEQRLLGLRNREWALVREVALLCHDQPWVYARSVMPESILSGSMRRLRQLQNESLGALLFSNPSLERDSFEICQLDAGSRYIHESLRQQSPAWARRSRFWLGAAPLSVSEVFLEQLQP